VLFGVRKTAVNRADVGEQVMKRAAIYGRVSTQGQDTENQLRENSAKPQDDTAGKSVISTLTMA
jgi:predicted site-specific integrase-resolvase